MDIVRQLSRHLGWVLSDKVLLNLSKSSIYLSDGVLKILNGPVFLVDGQLPIELQHIYGMGGVQLGFMASHIVTLCVDPAMGFKFMGRE